MKFKRVISICLAAAMMFGLTACGEKDKGSDDTIKIGLMGCFSGEYSVYGNAVANGATLYFKELNAAGGINGKQVEIVKYDDRGDATEAITAYSRMKEDGVVAVLGSVLTGSTLALVDEAYEDNMPVITASATAAGVTLLDPEKPSAGVRENVFRACFIDPFQGEKMAEYAYNKLGAKTAAIIFETGSDYSEGVKDAFVEKAKELGLTVTSAQGYATGDKDFRAQLTTIKSENPDVIFCPNYYEDCGMIVTQARQVGLTCTFMGADGWGGIKDYASAADLEGSVYCSGYAPGTTEAVKSFEANYQKEYSAEVPNMFAPLAYDAAKLLCAAIGEAEKAGKKAGSDAYSQAVIDALNATNGIAGITSDSYAFDEYNNPIKAAAIIELKSGAETFKEMY